MKTKLLKKVRERYSINSIYYDCKLPLYVLYEDNEYRYSDGNYNKVYEYLIYCIRDRYSHTKKNYRSKFKKIWWNGK